MANTQKQLEQIIKTLEKESGAPVEITVNYASGKKDVYGSLHDASFEVVPINLDQQPDTLQHDLDFVKGNYASYTELFMKVAMAGKLDGVLVKGGATPVLKNGTLSLLEFDPEEYSEIMNQVQAKDIPFLYHHIMVNPSGVYLAGPRESFAQGLGQKIAEIRYK